MSRFLFLAESYNELYLLCRDAENFLHKDNSVCLYKARQAGEFIVRQFVRAKKFQLGIQRLGKDGLASEEIISKLDFLRLSGNHAVHLNGFSEQEAIDSIDTLVSLTMWYALGTQKLRCDLNRFYVKDFSAVKAYYGEECFNDYLQKYNEEIEEADRIKNEDIQLISRAEIAKEALKKLNNQNEVIKKKLAEEQGRHQRLDTETKKNPKANLSNFLGKHLAIGSCIALGILLFVGCLTLKNNKIAPLTGLANNSLASTKNYDFNIEIDPKDYKTGPGQKNLLRMAENLLNQKGMSFNPNKGMDILKKLAENGYVEAQKSCGIHFFDGTGVSKDYEQALYWFKKAAAVRDGTSCYYVGIMNWQGYGTNVNLTEAHKYLNYAMEADIADSYFALGTLYLFGHGTPRDEKKAISYLKQYIDRYSDKPENKDAIVANYYIGITHVINFEKNIDTENIYEGIRHLTFAANHDYYEACYALGYCYHKGLGVEKNLSKSKELLQKAADHGVSEAKSYLKKLN